MVLAASSNATPTRQTLPGQTSALTDQTSSAQPFTEVLSEQTSKTSPDTSDKGESTNDSTPSSRASRGHPALSMKKIIVAEGSPVVVPVVPAVPVVIINAAPVAAPVVGAPDLTGAAAVAPVMTVHSVIEVPPGATQAMVVAVIDVGKEDVKLSVSPLEVDVSKHSGVGHSDSVQTMDLSRAASTEGVASGTLEAKMVVVGEKVGDVGLQDRPAPVDSTTRTTNSARDPRMTHVRSWLLGSDDVAKVATEVHTSQPMPTGLEVDARSEHLRDGSVRVASRLAEPVSGPASLPLAHSQLLDTPVLPVSPTSALVSSAGVLSASPHLVQSTPHALDVSELAGAISRPLTEGIGGYTVLVAMRPAELGQLQAVVTVHGNDLQVSITPQTHVGHEALANAVDTLKEKLSHGGVNVNVTLHDPGSQPRGDDRPATTTLRGGTFVSDEPTTVPPPSSVLTSSQIHLVL